MAPCNLRQTKRLLNFPAVTFKLSPNSFQGSLPNSTEELAREGNDVGIRGRVISGISFVSRKSFPYVLEPPGLKLEVVGWVYLAQSHIGCPAAVNAFCLRSGEVTSDDKNNSNLHLLKPPSFLNASQAVYDSTTEMQLALGI